MSRNHKHTSYELVADNGFEFGYVTGLAFGEHREGKRVWAHAVRYDNDDHKKAVAALRALADYIEAHYAMREER